MIAVFLAPLYLVLCLYLGLRAVGWMSVCHWLFRARWMRLFLGLVYLVLVFSILIAFFAPPSLFRVWMKRISNYWLGILMYLLLTIGTADLIRLLLRPWPFAWSARLFSAGGHRIVGAVCFAVVLLFTMVGILSQHHMVTTEYEIMVDKDGGRRKELNAVLVSDLHLGYNIGNWHMERMVERINRQKPDIVLIAGDIFDNEYEALYKPERLAQTLSGIKAGYGVYACYGNHDIQEPILAGFTFGKNSEEKKSDPRMDEFLKKAGITLLRDEGLLIDDSFYLYGRADGERPGRGIRVRKTPEEITANLDLTKPVIVLDHEPGQLQELAEAGVDVDLCGHTHDGQLFPLNLLMDRLWENACGYLKKGQMHNIVTSGVGVFGPNMRVGTKSEICRIKIRFR